jgi:hypothetical protein
VHTRWFLCSARKAEPPKYLDAAAAGVARERGRHYQEPALAVAGCASSRLPAVRAARQLSRSAQERITSRAISPAIGGIGLKVMASAGVAR